MGFKILLSSAVALVGGADEGRRGKGVPEGKVEGGGQGGAAKGGVERAIMLLEN